MTTIMENKKCFVCTGEIQLHSSSSTNPKQNSFLLCEILEMPLLGKEIQKFNEINYCPSCMTNISKISNMLVELRKLEKKVLDEKFAMEGQMVDNSKNYGSENSNIPSEQLRAKIVAVLRAKSMETMLGRLRRKEVGQQLRYQTQPLTLPELTISQLTSVTENIDRNGSGSTLNGLNGTDDMISVPEISLIHSPALPRPISIPLNFHFESQSSSSSTDQEEGTVDPTPIPLADSTQSCWTSEWEMDIKYENAEMDGQVSGDPLGEEALAFDMEQNQFHCMAGPIVVSTAGGSPQTEIVEVHDRIQSPSSARARMSLTCGNCDEKFDNFKDLELHSRSHSKIAKISASGRSKKIKKKREKLNIARKIAKVNPPGNGLRKTCDECGTIVKSQYLKYHILKCRKSQTKHICAVCNTGHRTVMLLKSHMKNVHSEKFFKCQFCEESYADKRNLLRHLSSCVHPADEQKRKRIKSKILKRAIKVKNIPKIRVRVNKKKIKTSLKHIKCEKCGKMYSSQPSLKIHVMTIHKNEKEYKYKCRICGHGYQYEAALNNHMCTHSKTKSFKCKICKASFEQEKVLNTHIKRAHPES